MIYPAHFRQYIIRPALRAIATAAQVPSLWSPAAEVLLLGTALQESSLTYIVQLGDTTGFGGHGFYQDEPEDVNDLWTNFLSFRPSLRAVVDLYTNDRRDRISQIETNMFFASIVCRLHYYRSPIAMPFGGDPQALASFYKTAYNTTLGAAQPAQVLANFQRAVATNV